MDIKCYTNTQTFGRVLKYDEKNGNDLAAIILSFLRSCFRLEF